jgi:hypothetical protein
MRTGLILATAVACVACVLEALAGDERRTIDVSRALDAATPPSPKSDVAISSTLPDPPPLVGRAQWVFDLRWNRGDIWLLGVHELVLPSPQPTPRALGRFAVELFEGAALIERVRFDFPLLGALESDASSSLTKKLATRIGVIFPATTRGTRLELWDRATNRRWSLPWPLPNATAGVDAGGLATPTDAAQGR